MRGLIFLGSLTAFVLVGVSAASSAQTTNAATQARWVMRDLGTFGQSYSECVAINDRGQVVCNAWVGDYSMIGMSPPRVNHAFVWQNGKETKLTLGGKQSGVNNGYISNGKAAAINGQGQVVGWAETKEGDQHAFLWENGKMRDLGTFGGKEGEAVAVNDRGQVVGWAETKKGDRHAFFWENGKMADLTPGRASTAIAINNRGQVVVSSRPDFLWEKGKTTRIGTAKDSVIPEAINERGQVVGWVDTKGDDSDGLSIYHAFLVAEREAARSRHAGRGEQRRGRRQRPRSGRGVGRHYAGRSARLPVGEGQDDRPRHSFWREREQRGRYQRAGPGRRRH